MSFTQYVAQLDITPGLTYAPFWSAFVQVLRTTMERQAGEARGQSSIRVSTSVTSDQFTVIVEDEGPGADWHAVRNACESLGGYVEVAPRAGESARISFVFPTQATASATAPKSHAAVPRRVGKRKTSAA